MKRTSTIAYLIVTGIIGIIAIWIFTTFYSGTPEATEYLTHFQLRNPAEEGVNRAGLNFGRVISFFFALGVGGAFALCMVSVWKQIPTYENVLRTWETEGRRLADGATEPDDVLKELTSKAAEGSRIRAALDSWQDISPDSDPEYIIEGKAVPHRQWLGILQTLASVLVLIGLVGNFFGLAEAVETLPQLPGAMSAAPTQEIKTERGLERQPVKNELKGEDAKKVEIYEVKTTSKTEATSAGPDTSKLEEKVQEISDGLQVVVISSVMGIGSMALLLMIVSFLRGLLNALIADEVVLLSAEIGTVLRPAGTAGFSAELKDGLIALPQQLANFDGAATRITETLGKYTTDFGEVSKNLDKLLENQLQDTQAAYQKYHTTLEEFTKVLVDQQGSVTQLTDTTKRLCENLEGISKSVKSVADQSANVGDRLNEIQLQYETYLKAATEDIENTRDVVTKLHQRIIDDADERMETQAKELKDALQNIADTLGEHTGREFERLAESLVGQMTEQNRERHEEMLSQISSVSESQLSQYDQQLERVESLVQAQEQLQEALSTDREEENALGENLAEAAESLKEARQALTDNRDKLIQVYDDLSHRQELAFRELVQSWKGAFEKGTDGLSPDGLVDLKDQLGGLGTQLSEMVDHLKSANGAKEVVLSSDSLRRLTENTTPVAGAPPNADSAAVAKQAIEQTVAPLIAETRRVVEAVNEMKDELGAGGPAAQRQQPIALPKIEIGKCSACGTLNAPGTLQCSDCGQVLSSSGVETLNALIYQLIETLESRPSGNLSTSNLEGQLRENHALVQTHQRQMESLVGQLPGKMQETLAPEIASVSQAVEGLIERLIEAVQRSQQSRPKRRRNSETQDLEPPKPAVEKSTQKEALAPPEPEKALPFLQRPISSFFRRKKK